MRVRKLWAVVLAAIVTLAFSVPGFAADIKKAAAKKPVAACGNDRLAFATGTPAGTYGKLGPTIEEYCKMVCETDETEGGLQNLRGVTTKKFDMGITQVDTIVFLSSTDPDIEKNVRSVASLHYSYLHMLTLRSGFSVAGTKKEKTWGGLSEKDVATSNTVVVKSVQDLRGKTIAAWGSALVTATVMNQRLRLNMNIVEAKTRPEGLEMVKKGQAYAFFGMGGKPVGWVADNVEAPGSIFTLVSLDANDLMALSKPYEADKLSYDNMGAYGVPTIKIRNEVVIRNITGGPLVTKIEAFKGCLAENLSEIKNARGTDPAWNDVSEETLFSTVGPAWTLPASKASGSKKK